MAIKDFGGSQIPSSPSAAAGIRAKLQGLAQAQQMSKPEKNVLDVPKNAEPDNKQVYRFRRKHDALLHIRIPASIKNDIRLLAEKNNVSQAEFIVSLVEVYKSINNS